MNDKKSKHIVKLYSTNSCPWCSVAKQYLEDNEISFEEIDVSSDYEAAMKMVQMSGSQGVPQIQIDEEIIVGFNKEAIDNLLELN